MGHIVGGHVRETPVPCLVAAGGGAVGADCHRHPAGNGTAGDDGEYRNPERGRRGGEG